MRGTKGERVRRRENGETGGRRKDTWQVQNEGQPRKEGRKERIDGIHQEGREGRRKNGETEGRLKDTWPGEERKGGREGGKKRRK